MLFSDLPKSVARLALRAAPRYIPYELLLSRKTKCIPPATLVPYNGCSYLTPCIAPCLGTLVSELRKKKKKEEKRGKCGFPWRQLFCSKIGRQESSVSCILMQMLGFNFGVKVDWGWWLGPEQSGGFFVGVGVCFAGLWGFQSKMRKKNTFFFFSKWSSDQYIKWFSKGKK